jgi:NAD(P)-dependent dehydrogenase (short-subunit alcohol dehydrogenase family)/acyl carrier protein
VTTVKSGTQFSQKGEEAYTVNPKAREDYYTLMRELRAAERTPNTIVHLWCLTKEEELSSVSDFFEVSQDLGFNSLLFLAQSIDDHLFREQIQIKVISNHLQEVTGEEVLAPEKATLLGPCRVVSQEYPNIKCTSIDIVLPTADAQQEEELLGLLLEELAAKTSEPIVAYRGRHRWLQTFQALRLEKLAHPSPRLRDNGVYLITGGLGGIGLALGEYLAQVVQAKLILIGRMSLPARGEWGQWLRTHNEQDTISRKIRKVQSIEEKGSEVLVLSADVADVIQMEEAIARSCDRFGQIHGVIHAAGIAGGGVMQLKRPQEAEGVLAPKVKGTLVLDEVLSEVKLDFFALCSALDSLLGGVGQADYCGANAFLDAYAHQHRSEDNILSINWCTWKEIGMAVDTAVPSVLKEQREHRLILGISPEEGKEAFGRILGSSFPQVIVSTQDFLALVEQKKEVTVSDSVEEKADACLVRQTYARPSLSNDYISPGTQTEQTIAEIWQQMLKIEKVGIHDNFFELGGNSLLAVHVIGHLRTKFPVDFTVASLFESPTVHSLSKMILKGQNGTSAFVESKRRGQKRKERRSRRKRQERGVQSHAGFGSI